MRNKWTYWNSSELTLGKTISSASQNSLKSLGERAPALHLLAVARVHGGIENEKNGVFSSAAELARVHGIDGDAL
jgi:hypothetical protein